MKRIALLAVLISVSNTALAGEISRPNRTQLNGWTLNDIKWNGPTLNGWTLNGLKMNAQGAQGVTLNVKASREAPSGLKAPHASARSGRLFVR